MKKIDKLQFFKIDYLDDDEQLNIEFKHEEEEVYTFIETISQENILGLYYIDLEANHIHIGIIKDEPEPYLGFGFTIDWKLDWEV
jgi:hypothetical protein